MGWSGSRSCVKLVALAIALSLVCAAGAPAATLQPIGSFEKPIFVTSDPGDADRLFVVEREGRVMQVQGGAAELFADLTSLVTCCAGERGLLSIALAPDFATSGRFYAAYTGEATAGGAEGDVHVDAFRSGGGGLVREPILAIDHSDETNHNGGQLQFGPDGFLYLSVGDGGGSGDPFESGQDLDTLLGKLLRIEPRPGQEPAYAIPPGNPFAAGAGRDEIWGYGLRNPWRFSFDRGSGDLAIADVGQGSREEVNFAPSPAPGATGGAGSNYGWSCREGFGVFPGAPAGCPAGGFAEPAFDYPHANPGGGQAHGCSITGGYVVRDASLGELYGRYVYTDFCQGDVRSLVLPSAAGGLATDDRSEGLSVAKPTSFGEDSRGRLYVTSNNGGVYRLDGRPPSDPASVPAYSDPQSPAPARESRRVRVRLKAAIGGAGYPLRLVLTVRTSPCAGVEPGRIQLNRGGRRFAAKQLDRLCAARFRTRIARRSTFRALLLRPDDTVAARSHRLAAAGPVR